MDSFTTFLSEHMYLFAGVIASILMAAFFAASETAMLFANKARLHQLADAGNARAEAALKLALERERLHSALLLVENFFLVLAVVLSTVIALHLFGGTLAATAVTAVVMSIVVVLFAKLAPKGLTARDPDRLALIVSYPMLFVMKLVSPVSRMVAAAADLFSGPAATRGLSCTAVVTEEDIKAMINLGEEEGALKEEEKELLHKVFEFGDTLASEAMRPRTEIVSIPAAAVIKDVLALVSEFGFSRYPVIEQTVDTVIGILYVKDILIAMSSGDVKRDDPIQPFIRQAYFIPENKKVSELLAEMQRDKFQIAIVIDEFGGTAGLVTLEDLIEEIVGSIHDELESVDRDVEVVDEKNVMVSGQAEIDEVNELLDVHIHTKDFNTIGGFVFGLFGRMPRVGEQLRYKDLKFEILELDGRKIDKIKITKL
ncbi:MAG: HlyC/CorC family transporter [Nitrospirae bacterium]|nr:HlyC/CorC family transporter [Nitrospirota bacterium]